ncbi:isocitrate/isopropylmalate dehydrogenase family protein [Candidatus Bathyarchaeota archaeon]|nr:isocitrate/isopropylmalate dehydrogenase family protein [Candidatus Bathyarchaeota archaeon]
MARKYTILGLIGDGIAHEIVPEAVKVLRALDEVYNLNLEILGPYPFGAKYWLESRRKSSWHPEITRELIYEVDGIFKGPVGLPELLEDVKLNYEVGFLPVNLRSELDLYANIRPCKLRPGVKSPLNGKKPGDIDFVIVRENTEHCLAEATHFGGIRDISGYFERAGKIEFAADVYVQTPKGCKRVIEYAFELAYKRNGAPIDGRKRVTCTCKWGLLRGDTLFKRTFDEVSLKYPDIEADYTWIDGWAYRAIMKPEFYDVVVTPNQYGDIISDLAGAIQGSMGLAAALNAGDDHAFAEATHGSAPDIAGKNIANPLSLILSVGMLLEWMGEKRKDKNLKAAGRQVDRAVDLVLSEGKVRTPDLGGSSTTQQVGDAVVEKIKFTASN